MNQPTFTPQASLTADSPRIAVPRLDALAVTTRREPDVAAIESLADYALAVARETGTKVSSHRVAKALGILCLHEPKDKYNAVFGGVYNPLPPEHETGRRESHARYHGAMAPVITVPTGLDSDERAHMMAVLIGFHMQHEALSERLAGNNAREVSGIFARALLAPKATLLTVWEEQIAKGPADWTELLAGVSA